jgi:DNA-binding beta-propeller fold protein YncE
MPKASRPSILRQARAGSTGSRPTDTMWVGERDGSHHGRSGAVWVVNRDKGEVTIFDARSGRPLATRPTGAGAHEVAISNDVDKAYITNENENTVSIVSTRTLASSKIALGPRPHHAEPSRDGDTILVGLVGANLVAAIDADTGQVSTYSSSPNPAANAHGPYLRDDTIYVAHEIGDEVIGIDAETGVIEFRVGEISQPTEVLTDRHERLLYVSARGEGKIKVIDLETRAVDEVVVGVQPETMLLTRNGRTLIVSMRGTPARLAFVDTKSLTLTDTIDLAGSGTFGDLAAMSRDGRFVYATFDRGTTGVGGVAVVDIKRRVVIDTWDYPGVGRVHGVAVSQHSPPMPDRT